MNGSSFCLFEVLICRDTDLLGFASDLYDAVVIKMIQDGHQIPAVPFLHRPGMDALKFVILKCLLGADRPVIAKAKLWGLKFIAVSDLNGRQGPCGGLFWCERPSTPFIVAVFKGTTPSSKFLFECELT